MRNFLIDIVFSLLLATGILFWQHRPLTPTPLNFRDIEANDIQVQAPAIILFWDWNIKSSHRAIQLYQRFHQAHPDITLYLVHQQTQTNDDLTGFLINLGVYTTPLYSNDWPSQVPKTILIQNDMRQEFHHSLHYTQLMEFFQKEF